MLHIEHSLHPLTEFAPVRTIPFWIAQYPDENDLDVMRNWILNNEQRLIAQYSDYSRSDGGTGLGKYSLTAQYNSFNLFSETKDIAEFQNLLKFLRQEYKNFMNAYGTAIRECSMYSWANVVRTGQSIDIHNHGATHYAYLSGNMHFDNYNTTTDYFNPFDTISYTRPNIKGVLTLFPSYLFHSASVHTEPFDRVSMAFDLYDKQHISGYESNKIDF